MPRTSTCDSFARILPLPTVVRAEGAIRERVLDATYPASHQGLSRRALASAQRYDLMTLVRGGEDRDLAAIVAMGHVAPFDIDFISNGTLIS